jgi:hypothetical protein
MRTYLVTVILSAGSYTTRAVCGHRASSTLDARRVVERLGEKLFPDESFEFEEAESPPDEGAATTRWILRAAKVSPK